MKSPQPEKRYSISFGLGPLIYGILSNSLKTNIGQSSWA